MSFSTSIHTTDSVWCLINEFGKSKTYVNTSSITRSGNTASAWIAYSLDPFGVDKRNGENVREMLMLEEYNLDNKCFRVYQSVFIYAEGTASAPIHFEPQWKPATNGNQATLEFLKQFHH